MSVYFLMELGEDVRVCRKDQESCLSAGHGFNDMLLAYKTPLQFETGTVNNCPHQL
jgi:hypothetical protein